MKLYRRIRQHAVSEKINGRYVQTRTTSDCGSTTHFIWRFAFGFLPLGRGMPWLSWDKWLFFCRMPNGWQVRVLVFGFGFLSKQGYKSIWGSSK